MTRMAIVSLLFGLGCATAGVRPDSAAAQCSLGQAAMADRGTVLYVLPDTTSRAMAELPDDVRVCAGETTVGFGFRRVRLMDGREGYAPESHLSL